MKPVYLQELKKYRPEDFQQSLGLSDEEFRAAKQELQANRILKVSMDGYYSIQFVGVILCFRKLIFCLPKYINRSDSEKSIQQLLMLFRQYSKREKLDQEEMDSFGDMESLSKFNILSVILFLLDDYLENDLYHNDKIIYVLNGENGDIDWDKTINDEYAVINDGNPIYLNYYVQNSINDENDYFRLLHMYVLTSCTSILLEVGLGDYFGFPPVVFDIDAGALGSKEMILSKIMSEMSVQFVNRKQKVLKAIAAFISHDTDQKSNNLVEFYGTRNFEVVWEKICGFVLDNQFEHVKPFIDKPVWNPVNGAGHEVDTLKPDVISIFSGNTKKYFIISDAKYYNIKLTEAIVANNPGVGDITKQYLYQLSFRKLIQQRNFSVVHNVLLFPTEKESIEYIGKVTIGFLKDLGLKDIILIRLPVQEVFQMYIDFRKLELEMFGDYIDQKVSKAD